MGDEPEELPSPRQAMLQAVQCATAGMNEAAIAWSRIAAELRAGWTPLTYDVTPRQNGKAPADRIFGYARGQDEPPTYQQVQDARAQLKWVRTSNGQPKLIAEAELTLLQEIVTRYEAVKIGSSLRERAAMFEAVIRTDEAKEAYAKAAADHQASAEVIPAVADLAATQQINGDPEQCRWCLGRLIWHEAPGTAQHGWLHRSTYQAVCPVPDSDSGRHTFAEPAS